MKLMIIKNSRSYSSLGEIFGKFFMQKVYRNYSGRSVVELLKSEHPHFVSLKLKEPVNGDNDMMSMLSSIDENTRLRVSILDTKTISNYLGLIFLRTKNFILPGTTHNPDTL